MYIAQLRKLTTPNLLNRFRVPALAIIFILAYFAHAAFVKQQLSGFLFLGLAGLLLVMFTPPQVLSSALSGHQLNLSSGRRFTIAVGLLLVSVVLLLDTARVFAIQLNHTVGTNADPWNRFIPALGLWLARRVLFLQNQYGMPLGRTFMLLLMIFGVCVFLLLYLLNFLPPGICDECLALGVA